MTLTTEQKITLQDERNTDPLNLGLRGCSSQIFMQNLNVEGSGSTDTRVIPNREINITRNQIRKQISVGSLAGLRNWLDSKVDNNAIAANDLWSDSSNYVDMSFPQVRQLITSMGSTGYEIMTDEEVINVLSLGEVGQSRSQELIGRNITLIEAQEVE